MEAPYFLVALPQLDDEIFSRAVILVGHHDEQGAFGLLLNKPLLDEKDSLSQMITEVKDTQGNTLYEFHEDIFEGGPVNEGAIFALHEIQELGTDDSDLGHELYLSSDPVLFQKLLENEKFKSQRRFYLGCSSWKGGQIESELRSGSWLVVPYSRQFIFHSVQNIFDKGPESWRDEFWQKVLVYGGCNPLTVMTPGNSDSGYN